jgi:hypothetical protein
MALPHGAPRLRPVSVTGNSTTWRAPVTSRTAGLADIADSGATGQAIQSLRSDGDRVCASRSRRSARTPDRRTLATDDLRRSRHRSEGETTTHGPRPPAISDGDDPPSVAFRDLRDGLTGPLFEHVQAAFIGAHARIMRGCGHRSSCHCCSSVLPTFTD